MSLPDAWMLYAAGLGLAVTEIRELAEPVGWVAWVRRTYGADLAGPAAEAADRLMALRARLVADAEADGRHPRALAAALAQGVAEALGVEVGDVCPSYPALPWDLACRVALGDPPRALAPGLTSREAHAWALAGAPPVDAWLADRLGLPNPDVWRGIPVVRWAAACMRDARRGRLLGIAHPDIIEPADIEATTDPPSLVMARAEARAALASAGASIGPPVPWPGRRLRGVRPLRTPWALASEGRALSHCVASYAERVARGESVILSLRAHVHRATAEIDRRGRVRQVKAAANADPHPVILRLLSAQMREWGLSA